MTQFKSNRITFLKGLGGTAIAALFFMRKNKGFSPDSNERSINSTQLPLVARKAPKALPREDRQV